LYVVECTEGHGWPKHVEINVNTVLLYFLLYYMLCWFWCYELFQNPSSIRCWVGYFWVGYFFTYKQFYTCMFCVWEQILRAPNTLS
jgi:hypothetical protein